MKIFLRPLDGVSKESKILTFLTLLLFEALWICLHVLPVHVWDFSGRSGFLPQPKDVLDGWIDQKLTTGVSGSGGPSLCVSPVMRWPPFQGVLRLSPLSQLIPATHVWIKQEQKMDEYLI